MAEQFYRDFPNQRPGEVSKLGTGMTDAFPDSKLIDKSANVNDQR